MILATDLDGTFLAGSDAARGRLIGRFLERPDARLVYVTGRSVRSVLSLIDDGTLPAPDAMICDVGTFIAHGDGSPLTGPAMNGIEARWRGKAEPLREAMAAFPSLELQEHFGPNRLGYYYRDAAVIEPASAAVRELGCDPLDSDGIYFDVLPRGVNKGSTLRALMRSWAIDDDEVLVAGDTLNDLAMLHSGYRAVAVGGAEAGLLEQLPASERIFRAQAGGCDGIVEALQHFNFSNS